MKKIFLTLTFVFFTCLAFSQNFLIQEDVAFVKESTTFNKDNVQTVYSSPYEDHYIVCSKTSLGFNYNIFNASSKFIYNANYFSTFNTLNISYDLTEKLAVSLNGDYNYKAYDNLSNQELKVYAGASLTENWKFFNLKLSGFVGYDILDTTTIGNLTVDLGNELTIGFRADLNVTKYVTLFAGIESYQVLNGSITAWLPKSINNYIGAEVNYDVTKNVTLLASVYHVCRHPESVCIYNKDTNCLNKGYTEITAGCKISF